MKLKYKCLVFDHDDTVMDSTRHVHWPAFLGAMEQMRPGVYLSLEDYFRVNFEPGFFGYCREQLRFTDEDFQKEVKIWQSYVDRTVPEVFPGVDRIIKKQKELGGFVCVSSHSLSWNIRRDYRENGLPEPDLIYGWDLEQAQRKPATYSLEQIMEKLDLKPSELLMIDDLKPGYLMAKACGVDFAAVGWAYDIPEIEDFMRENCDRYFKTAEELEHFLFEPESCHSERSEESPCMSEDSSAQAPQNDRTESC